MTRMNYEPAKTLLLFSFGFWTFGPLPRMIGIFETKPEHAGWIPYMDGIATTIFAATLIWVIYIMVYNTRQG